MKIDSSHDSIKKRVLPSTIADNYTVLKGESFNIGFEVEEYLHLKTEPKYVQEFLDSMQLQPLSSESYKYGVNWFPEDTLNYFLFERKQFDKEILEQVFISRDSSNIYYFRLFW